jgi:hypothetical protein
MGSLWPLSAANGKETRGSEMKSRLPDAVQLCVTISESSGSSVRTGRAALALQSRLAWCIRATPSAMVFSSASKTSRISCSVTQ